MKGFRLIGQRPIAFNGAGEGGGGAAPQPDMDSHRVSALEARLGQLVGAVTTLAQRDTQREAQSRIQQDLATVESIVRDADTKVATARAKLAAAHESGDSQQIAAATADVSVAAAEATAAKMQAEAMRRDAQAAPAPQPPAPQHQTQQQVDDSNLRSWRERNKEWYGVDTELTHAALAASKAIEAERILEVGSAEYFRAVDARLRAKFPDKFAPPQNPGQFTTQRGTAVPQDRNQDTSRVIPASVAEGARRMGINVDDPETAKQFLAARQIAVQKGFLPEKANTDRIITR